LNTRDISSFKFPKPFRWSPTYLTGKGCSKISVCSKNLIQIDTGFVPFHIYVIPPILKNRFAVSDTYLFFKTSAAYSKSYLLDTIQQKNKLIISTDLGKFT